MDWSRKYRQRGLAGLQDHRGGPVRAKLKAEQLAELKQKLGKYRPRGLFGANCGTSSGADWTIVDLARAVERVLLCGYLRAQTHYGEIARVARKILIWVRIF